MYKQGIGNTRHISLDDICELVTTEVYLDDNFVQKTREVKEEMYCSVTNVNQYEFRNAQASGNKPALTFIFNYDDYKDNSHLLYEGKKYTIYRTFVRQDGYIECHSEVKQGG